MASRSAASRNGAAGSATHCSALGCQDPVERVSEAKARDGRRQQIGDLFTLWWEKHSDQPVAVSQLDPTGEGNWQTPRDAVGSISLRAWRTLPVRALPASS